MWTESGRQWRLCMLTSDLTVPSLLPSFFPLICSATKQNCLSDVLLNLVRNRTRKLDSLSQVKDFRDKKTIPEKTYLWITESLPTPPFRGICWGFVKPCAPSIRHLPQKVCLGMKVLLKKIFIFIYRVNLLNVLNNQ